MYPSFGATPSTLRHGIVDAGYNSFAFFNHEESIDARQVDVFDKAAGPMNLDGLDVCRLPQPKVKALVIRGFVAAPAHYIGALADTAGGQVDRGPDRIARTFGPANQRKAYPMVF